MDRALEDWVGLWAWFVSSNDQRINVCLLIVLKAEKFKTRWPGPGSSKSVQGPTCQDGVLA